MKISKPEYVEQALLLSEDEQQKIMSRMTGKLPKRLLKEKLSVEEAVAIQLEIEEEQLAEWRKNWEKIKKGDSAKKSGVTSKPISKSVQTAAASTKPKAAAPASKTRVASAKPGSKAVTPKAKSAKPA